MGRGRISCLLLALGWLAFSSSCQQPDPTAPASRPDAPTRAGAPVPAATAGVPAPFRMGRPDLVILVTGGANGMLEPCNCGREMAGGQARKSSVVRAYRALCANLLVVDTGDAFDKDHPESVKNVYVARGLQKIGYDALVLGDQEWAAPDERLRTALTPGRTAWLSTTVFSKSLAGAPLAREVLREFPGLKVAVLSDNHDRGFLFMPASRRQDLSFLPAPDLAGKVDDFKRRGFLVVIATHGDNLQLEETARATAADLFLRGNTLQTEPALLAAHGKPVAKVGGEGNLGVLALRVRDGRITESEWRVEVLDKRWPADNVLYENYVAYTHEAMREAMQALRPESLPYVPVSECRECHPVQTASWQRSKHAHAYDTLVAQRRQGDPDCLRCHTTGFGTQGGFHSIERTPQLANVLCQACHPMDLKEHRGSARRAPAITPQTCLGCHTPENDANFEFETRRAAARCATNPVK